MARKPNYSYEKFQREKAKAEKKAARLEAKAEKKAAEKALLEGTPPQPETPSDPQEQSD